MLCNRCTHIFQQSFSHVDDEGALAMLQKTVHQNLDGLIYGQMGVPEVGSGNKQIHNFRLKLLESRIKIKIQRLEVHTFYTIFSVC